MKKLLLLLLEFNMCQLQTEIEIFVYSIIKGKVIHTDPSTENYKFGVLFDLQ